MRRRLRFPPARNIPRRSAQIWAGRCAETATGRVDSFARVFNDKPYDQLHGYTNFNLSLILTNQDGWQAMAYVKNVFDTTAITGAFLNSDDTGLADQRFHHRSTSIRTSPYEELVGIGRLASFTSGGGAIRRLYRKRMQIQRWHGPARDRYFHSAPRMPQFRRRNIVAIALARPTGPVRFAANCKPRFLSSHST